MRILLSLTLVAFVSPAWSAVERTPVVVVRQMLQNEIADELNYPARVEAKVNAKMLAEFEGVVTRIQAPLGSTVKRGQSVLTVKQTDPVYQYAPGVVPSPVGGVVSQMEVTEGSRVVKGQSLASVTDPKSLRVSVEIPAQDLAFMVPNLNATLTLSGTEEKSAIKLRGVSPHVDPATGTATAEFEAVNPGQIFLRPGMVGKVHMRVNVHNAFTIAEDAVVYKNGKTWLRIVEQGKAKLVNVGLGRRHRGEIEIKTGITDKMNVIERASSYVAEGDTVKVESKAQGG